jgi:hypothetical protein
LPVTLLKRTTAIKIQFIRNLPATNTTNEFSKNYITTGQ